MAKRGVPPSPDLSHQGRGIWIGSRSRRRPGIRLPGYYGWWIVFAAWASFLVGFGVIYQSFGVFFTRWETEFGWSRGLIGGVQTVVNLTVALLGPLLGMLSDRVSSKVLVFCGATLSGTGVFLLGFVHSPWQLYLFYLVAALGLAASGHVVLIALISRWFHNRRGSALGMAETGMGMAGVVMVPVASALVLWIGWRRAEMALAVLIWAIILPLAAFVVRSSPGPKDVEPGAASAQRDRHNPSTSAGLSVREALRTWQLWTLVVAMALGGLASSGASQHLLPLLKDLGSSPGVSAALYSLSSAALLGAKLFFGFSSDRASPKRALLMALSLGVAAALVGVALLSWAHPMALVMLGAVAIGAVAGSFTVIMPTITASLFGARRLGSLLGLVFMFAMTGMALGPFVAGRMFDVSGSYRSYFLLCLGLYLVALIAAVNLRPVAGVATSSQPMDNLSPKRRAGPM